MSKVAVLLLCACSAIAWQNPPRLRRVGPSDAAVTGNLEGFRPLHKVWPDVTTNWTNGRRISVSALVAQGKSYEFHVTGDPDHVAEPFLDALKKWRFAMPADGTSPVKFTVIWEAQDGRFFVQETSLALAAAGQAVAQQSGGAIEGQVVDAVTHAPVRKALVTLWRQTSNGGSTSSRVEADSSGRFVFGNLQPGSYSVGADATGYIGGGPTTGLPVKAGYQFALGDGQTLTGIAISLTPSSAISGSIVDEDGDPLPDFRLQLFEAIYNSGQKQFNGLAGANTDDRGRYRIAGIPAGKYYLTVSPHIGFFRGRLGLALSIIWTRISFVQWMVRESP